jgi:hypothetical protein
MSLAIGLVSFWYRSYRDAPPTFPQFWRHSQRRSRLLAARPKIANEACGSNNGSVDSLSGHQLPSVSFRCHLPSIWYRLYRDALATASTTLDEPLLPPLSPNATPKRGLPQEPRSKPEARDVGM